MQKISLYVLSAALLASTVLSGCTSTLDRLDRVGQPPAFAPVVDPTTKPDYQPISWPMPETPPPPKQYANSLWQPGARAFFRDGRAARVGDILRVNIEIKDKAEVDNETEGKRDSSDNSSAAAAMGLQTKLAKILPLGRQVDPTNILDTSSSLNTKGTGKIKRKETITTQVAALITQVLPNGNFVIEGKQEINVNYELREVSVTGVIRPQDINSDNTIDSTQIAEARINYGGRGQISDVQQPAWGTQIVRTLAPF